MHAFFAFHTQAGRLFHGPTFLASLELPPADPRFPFDAVLHAMCAVGSLYTAAIPQAPIQPRARRAGAPSASPFAWADDSGEDAGSGQLLAFDELFPGRWRKYERRPDSFAELQAAFAKRTAEESIDRGERLLECLQSGSPFLVRAGRGLTRGGCSERHSRVVLPVPGQVSAVPAGARARQR